MISFFSIQGIVDQLQIISNPNTIDIDWLRLRSDSASLPRSLKLQRQHCIAQQGKHDGDCRPLQKKEKSGRPSGSGPKNAQTIRLFWCNATNETQFSLIGSWLSNICNPDTMWLNCVNIGRGRLRQSLLQLRKNCRIDLILARQRDNDRPLCVFAADQWNYIFKHDAKPAHQPSLFKQTIF